jgi:hypothetical protein
MSETVVCPTCVRVSSSRARWCVGCRTPLGAAAPGEVVPSAPGEAQVGGCPLCGGPAGTGTLSVRQRGDSHTTGIPLVFSVTTTEYSDGVLSGFCSGCRTGIELKRLGTAVAIAALGVGVTGIAGVTNFFPLAVIGIGGIALTLRGLRYGFSDDLVWGTELARRLGLDGSNWEFPAPFAMFLLRAFIVIAGFSISLGLLPFVDE